MQDSAMYHRCRSLSRGPNLRVREIPAPTKPESRMRDHSREMLPLERSLDGEAIRQPPHGAGLDVTQGAGFVCASVKVSATSLSRRSYATTGRSSGAARTQEAIRSARARGALGEPCRPGTPSPRRRHESLARIIRKGSDFGSQDGVIVSRTKDRTLPLSSAGHVGRKIGRMARCERPAGQLRRGRSREAR